jgi:predicted permease
METLLRDFRHAIRTLRRNPGFSFIAVLTLALGIGANTAIFSLTDQILLRSLPVHEPDELVVLRSPGPTRGRLWSDGDPGQSFSYPMYKAIRDRDTVFAGVLARFATEVSLSGGGQTERGSGEMVSGNYFQVLGVTPALGRTFTQEDDQAPGGHPLVVLSHGYWTRRYGNDPGVLNQSLTVNGMPMTIVGVTRAGFEGVQIGQVPDIFVPIAMKDTITPNWLGSLTSHRDYWAALIARLKPGITREQAEEAVRPVYRGILEEVLPLMGNWPADVRERFLDKRLLMVPGSQGRDTLQRDAKTPLLVLMGMVGLVLLIACGNVANLMMARGAARQREIAVRMALGAGRGRLIKQFLVESVLLSLVGGAVGLLVASWTSNALISAIPASAGMLGLKADLDVRILGFSLILSILAGIIFGLMPAFRSTKLNLETTLREQGSSVSGGRSQVRFRKALVASQIILTSVLLIGAGLFARSLSNLRGVDLGVRTDHLIEFTVSPALNGYTPERAKALFERVREGLNGVPGVEATTAAEIGLFTDSNSSSNMTIEGYQAAEGEDMNVFRNGIGPSFFSTMGIPLVSGREFNASDTATSQKVGIINEAMARRFFAGRDPIGRRFRIGAGPEPPDIEIVGVVKASKHATVKEVEQPFAYFPYLQEPDLGRLTFYVLTSGEPSSISGAIRAEVRRHDDDLPVFEMKTFEARVDESLFGERLMSMMSVSFGFLAAALAAIGLYGVMTYTVARRTREIGIRMALGASQGSVARLILREVGVLLLIGLLVGLPAGFALGRLAEAILFGVKASDPIVFVIVTVMLCSVSLLGGFLPARKAAGVDPIRALRYE